MTATDAKVDAVAVAEGPDGTIFMADDRGGRVLAIDATGHLHLVAGTGRAASGGDGGPATEASLRHPTAVAVTRDGELLVAEAQGARPPHSRRRNHQHGPGNRDAGIIG